MTQAWVLAGVALLAGTSDPELTNKNPFAPSLDVSNQHVVGTRWRTPVVRQGFDREVPTSFGQPGVAGRAGLVIVGTGEGKLLGLDARHGRKVWEVDQDTSLEAWITVLEEPTAGTPQEWAVTSRRDGVLVAFGAMNGNELWRTDLGGETRAPAVLRGNTLLVSTVQNKIFALDAKTGQAHWTNGRSPSQGLSIEGIAAPVADDKTVYAAFADGYVEAYRLEDGSRAWSRPLSLGGGEFVDADADPVLANGRLFVASYSDGVYALDPANGNTLWSRPVQAIVALGHTSRGVVAASSEGFLWTFADKDGAMLARVRLPKGPMSRLVVDKDLVMLTSGESGLLVFDAVSNKPLQATAFPDRFQGDPGFSPVDGTLAAISSSGHVYGFRIGAPSFVE